MHALPGRGTDSIHLAPESIDDDANGLIARDFVVGVADVKLDCHGDLAFVAREGPAVEGHVRGLHGGCRFVVGLAVRFVVVVGFAVGFAGGFAVRRFRHDWIVVFCGRIWGFCRRTKFVS